MTRLDLYKGRAYQRCETRDEFASLLVRIERAADGCHRFVFAEVMTDADDEESAQIVARWVFTTAFLKSLLEIIPHYLALCETAATEPPQIDDEKVVRFPKRVLN